MTVVDWAATWNPVPDDRPCRVRVPEPGEPGSRRSRTPAARRPSHSAALTLSPAQTQDLPCWLPRLLANTDVDPGDQVTVDLGASTSVHLSGLALLFRALWRRVGPHGRVAVTGGTRGLRAQLASLDATPVACRAAVFGQPELPREPNAPVPARIPNGMVGPAQPVGGPVPRLVLTGDVNLTADWRSQARLNKLAERGPRILVIDVSQVIHLSLSSLRLLLAADAQLRARGGRLLLRGMTTPVWRLLEITNTRWLAEEQPGGPRRDGADICVRARRHHGCTARGGRARPRTREHHDSDHGEGWGAGVVRQSLRGVAATCGDMEDARDDLRFWRVAVDVSRLKHPLSRFHTQRQTLQQFGRVLPAGRSDARPSTERTSLWRCSWTCTTSRAAWPRATWRPPTRLTSQCRTRMG